MPDTQRTPRDGPASVAGVAGLMASFGPHWALCGGWAVDAWLGRQTREHGDIDVSVFHDDQRALFDHLAGWQLIAHDPTLEGDTAALWDGRRLELPAHIHARPSGPDPLPDRLRIPESEGFGLDIQLDERSGAEWIFSHSPRVTAPLDRCVGTSDWGVPTLRPGVLLFYKAQERRPHDEADFVALLPRLAKDERSRLSDAIARVHPGHPWLPALSAERS